jgi:hypothetical protein
LGLFAGQVYALDSHGGGHPPVVPLVPLLEEVVGPFPPVVVPEDPPVVVPVPLVVASGGFCGPPQAARANEAANINEIRMVAPPAGY